MNLLTTFSFMCQFIGVLYAFNLDVQDRVLLSGPANSYFGYSVAIVSDKWILVGSPHANDSNLPGVVEPGGVHKCAVTKTPSPCQQLHLDTPSSQETLSFNGDPKTIVPGYTRQWLGGSLAVPSAGTGKGIIVCAHRWHTKYTNYYIYAMNGMCFELPLDLEIDNDNIRKFSPYAGSWDKFAYGMDMLGIDAHYTAGDKDLLLGSPGVHSQNGGFVDVTSTTTTRDEFFSATGANGKIMKSDPSFSEASLANLIGYSVTSGAYFGDGVTYFVLGVPRANLTGKLILFDSRASEYNLDSNVAMEIFPNGNTNEYKSIPFNTYFGGTLCTIDVNHDGIDDLLVGAPMYSYLATDHVDDINDMGNVFLYLGSRGKPISFKTSIGRFSGSRSVYARFGSAISNLGDVNKDDYNDVAIGAPYEDDMTGCVYVYNGYKDGLWPKYSQRISAKQFNHIPKGFGIAISPAADLNNDNINDVAIGAYISDHVLVLHGQPVINMQAEMKVQNSSGQDVLLIHASKQQKTSVRMCFKYTDTDRLCEFVVLNTSISLDTGKGKLGRLVFKDKDSPILHSQVKIFRGTTTCTRDGLLMVKNAHDLISGIVVMSEYEIADISCSGADISPTINKFDGNNPGDPVLNVQKTLYFKTECPENNCHTDLHVAAKTEFTGVDGYFVIGESDLIIHVNITKDGHPSYGSAFEMVFPKYLRYRKMKQLAGGTEVSCSIESTNKQLKATDNTKPDNLVKEAGESMLSCSFGNPLVNDSGVEFCLYIEVPDKVTVPSFELKINATSQSNETSVGDNEKTLAVNLRYHVQTSVTGISSPVTMFIRDTTPDSTITHVYELTNNGPSILPSAVLGFHYPQKQQGTTADLYLNATKDCSKGSCSLYECSLKSLLARSSTVVELEFVVRKSIQGEIQSRRSTDIVSVASIHLEKEGVISDKTQFDMKLTTRLLPRTPPAAELGSKWWVILVSGLSGFLLIVIIVIIMFKCGYFKRKQREELVKLKRQTAMMKHQSTINTPNVTCNDDNVSYTGSQGGIIDKEQLPSRDKDDLPAVN